MTKKHQRCGPQPPQLRRRGFEAIVPATRELERGSGDGGEATHLRCLLVTGWCLPGRGTTTKAPSHPGLDRTDVLLAASLRTHAAGEREHKHHPCDQRHSLDAPEARPVTQGIELHAHQADARIRIRMVLRIEPPRQRARAHVGRCGQERARQVDAEPAPEHRQRTLAAPPAASSAAP